MKSYVENCVNLMKHEYKNNPRRIRSDYNRELEAIEIYKGRELLELIQNADDELLEGMSKDIRLSFIDNVLTVSNNGTPFSEEGVDSLMISDLSSKTHKQDVIGNKGKGFRAILGWAKEIKIFSGDLSVRFSDDYSQSVLGEIIKNTENTSNGKPLKAATLVFPEWIETPENRSFTTDISICVNDDEAVVNDIYKQLYDIDCELLLFLNRAEGLIIETDEKTVSFKKRPFSTERILIEKYVNGNLEDEQEWLLNRYSGEFIEKKFSVVVAYNPDGLNSKRQVIYSYFPTDVEFPFPVLLHANFNLNSDRNHLTKANEANRYILKHACILLVDTALKLTKDEVSYSPLLVLAPEKPIIKELVDYGFEEMLNEEIRHSKVFPAVNGNYISFDESPKFHTSYLSQSLEGEGFDDLLISTESRVIRNLIRKLNSGSYPEYTYEDVVKKINAWAKTHTPNESTMEKHAYCAVGFLEDYEHDLKPHKKMPLLIYDTDSRLTSNEHSIFLRDRNANISSPPGFAQIRFMHPDMRSAFENILKVTGRNLALKLSSFGVKEYNTPRIIEKMNSIIKKRLDEDKTTKAKRFCGFEMKWLWDNRQILENAGEKIKIYFITRNGEVRLSDELYFGKEYENQICENLFEGLFEERFVDDIKTHINIGESSLQEITAFLQTLGVDKFPKRKIKRVRPDESYKSRLLEALYYPYTLEGDTFKDLNDFSKRIFSIAAEIMVIEELESILNNCETQHIIEWIKADSGLSQILYTRKEISNSRVEIKWDLKQNPRTLPLDKIYAYIYWQFENIAWLKVGDKRYKMSDCILSKIGTMLEPALVEPDVDIYIKDIDGSKSRIRNEYGFILGKLGVENDFADLPAEKIYTILNLLPNIRGGESIAKRFYAELIKSDQTISDEELNCQAYKQFMESGRVLCNSGYQKNSESWYLDGKNICEKIANTYNLLEVSKRQNSSKIERLLGVKKLVLKGEVVGNPLIHPENEFFRKDFSLYKPMAFCYRIENATKDEARRFSELDIVLCTDLTARYTGNEIELDDYDFILKDSKTFYLKVPKTLKSLDDMKRNVSFSAAIANVLCSFIDVTESFAAFRELYGASDSSRKELIHQIFEDDSILERVKVELNYSEYTKEEFIRIISKCSGKSPIDVIELISDIDFDNFTSISNAKPIIHCFRQLNIDVDKYNAEEPVSQIELYQYYQAELSRLMPKYEGLYRQHHFQRLKGRGIEEKKKLVELFLNYEYIKPEIKDSVYFDCEAELINCLQINKDTVTVDLISLYNTNLASWKAGLNNTTYIDELLKFPANMSYLYYGEYKELNKAHEELLAAQLVGEDETEHEDTEDIVPEVIRPKTVPAQQEAKTNGNNDSKKTGFSPPKNLEKIGFKGEKYVFEELKKTYPSIKWVSENAKEVGVNPEGRAGLGYDLEYLDENENRIFVEVKASKSSEISFYLSDYEFDFATKHIAEYEIYFVSDVLTKKPKILVLDNVFVGSDFNSINYALNTKREYKITANLIDQ